MSSRGGGVRTQAIDQRYALIAETADRFNNAPKITEQAAAEARAHEVAVRVGEAAVQRARARGAQPGPELMVARRNAYEQARATYLRREQRGQGLSPKGTVHSPSPQAVKTTASQRAIVRDMEQRLTLNRYYTQIPRAAMEQELARYQKGDFSEPKLSHGTKGETLQAKIGRLTTDWGRFEAWQSYGPGKSLSAEQRGAVMAKTAPTLDKLNTLRSEDARLARYPLDLQEAKRNPGAISRSTTPSFYKNGRYVGPAEYKPSRSRTPGSTRRQKTA